MKSQNRTNPSTSNLKMDQTHNKHIQIDSIQSNGKFKMGRAKKAIKPKQEKNKMKPTKTDHRIVILIEFDI